MFRRTLMLPVVVGLVLAIVGSASAAIVRVRVEGKSQTIFGATQPRASATTALGALESASIGGEFYYHVQVTGFGPYVDQIGRNAAAGFGGWAFKVNGASPPVGADKVELKDGDVVLWYWATFTEAGGPPTLELSRERGGCYRVVAKNDAGNHRRRRRHLACGLQTCADAGRSRLSRPSSESRASDCPRCGAVERAEIAEVGMRRLLPLLCLVAALAGCGGSDDGGEATLWVTRDRGAEVLVTASVPAGVTAMQALRSEADVDTSFGGRFVQSIEGVSGDAGAKQDWFYFVNGVEADRGAAEYRLRPGDVLWWDYRSWAGDDMREPVVVGAFPEPFLHGYDGRVRPVAVRFEAEHMRGTALGLAHLIGARSVEPLSVPGRVRRPTRS